MKIGIIAHNAHPIREPFEGGLEMLTHLLINELYDRGHHVTTLCVKDSEVKGSMVFYKDSDFMVESSDLKDFSQFYGSMVNFLKNDFDIIHNHSLSHHAISMGAITTIPFITTFHTPIFDNINVSIEAVSKNPNQRFTAVSNSLRDLYLKHLDKVETVYNGIDLSKWQMSEIKLDYFSWCGRICKEKGLKEIIDLCEDHAVNIKFAGPISDLEYFEDHILPRIKSYKYCEYIGHLKQDLVNGFISRSKAFLFTSIWEEPYGLVIAEALASGSPVIANNVGAANEILSKHSGVLFNLSDTESFKSALLDLDYLSSADCRLRAEKFCSHMIMVDNYERLYREILNVEIK
ncbi:MAG: glycosyltransferase [Psychroserpens sp.]|uniref:glycosyltransferase n=1 Tax=Psychroserpens sp. TaxID=2020870 RepID=UPI003C781802